MIPDIFKSIALGLIGAGGIVAAIYFGINKIDDASLNSDLFSSTKTISEESVLTFENNNKGDFQYQFLYKLAKKIFPYLKNKNGSAQEGTKEVTQDDLISWLASEFGQSNLGSDNWQNFKSLCEEQKKKDDAITPTESDGEDNVEVPASRVCYMDNGFVYTTMGNYEKGFLGLWETEDSGYNGFGMWNWSNLLLWEYFRTKYPTESPLDKFDDWYETQIKNDKENKITNIKTILEK